MTLTAQSTVMKNRLWYPAFLCLAIILNLIVLYIVGGWQSLLRGFLVAVIGYFMGYFFGVWTRR